MTSAALEYRTNPLNKSQTALPLLPLSGDWPHDHFSGWAAFRVGGMDGGREGGRPVATPLDSLPSCLPSFALQTAPSLLNVVRPSPSESNSATPPARRPSDKRRLRRAVVDAFRNVEKSASLLTHTATPLDDDDDISSAQKGLGG